MQNRIGWCNKYMLKLFLPMIINNVKAFNEVRTLKKTDLPVRDLIREAIIPIEKTISQGKIGR